MKKLLQYLFLGIALLLAAVSTTACDSVKPLQATTADYFDMNYNGYTLKLKDYENIVVRLQTADANQMVFIEPSEKDKGYFKLVKFTPEEIIQASNTLSDSPISDKPGRIAVRVGDLKLSSFPQRGN